MKIQKYFLIFPVLLLTCVIITYGKEKISLIEIYKRGKIFFNPEVTLSKKQLNKKTFFGKPVDITGDEDGNIYILDSTAGNIKKINSCGEIIRVLGEKKRNSRLFVKPVRITYVKDRLVVWDIETKRLYTLTTEGEILKTKKISMFDAWPRKLRGMPDGNILISSLKRFINDSGKGQELMLDVYSPELKHEKTVYSQEIWIWKYNEKVGRKISVPFYPSLHWDLQKNGNIVFGFSEKYKISVLDPETGHQERFSHTYHPVKVTTEDKNDYLSRYKYTIDDRDVPLPDIIQRNFEWPEHMPAFFNISIDWEDNILVSKYHPDKNKQNKQFDTFDPGGKFINEVEIMGDVSFPETDSAIFFGTDSVWMIESKEDDNYSIVKYGVSGSISELPQHEVSTKVNLYSDIFLTKKGLLPLARNAIELEVDGSLNSDRFQSPSKIDSDDKGNIYVLDAKANKIFIFDQKGNLINSLEEKKGTFKFRQLDNLLVSNGQIIIYDIKQKRILHFNLRGGFLNQGRLSNFKDFDMDSKGNYYLVRDVENRNSHLISIYNQKTQLISSFGKPLSFHHSLPILNSASIAVNNQGDIYLAFKYFPLVRKYSPEFILIDEYQIDTPIMEAKNNYNLIRIGSSIASPSLRAGYRDVITAVEIFKGEIFLLSYYPRLEILKLIGGGQDYVSYWIDLQDIYEVLDFCIMEIQGELRFFILQADSSLYQIKVFRIKDKSIKADRDERIEDLTDTLKMNPVYVPAYINRGIEKYNKGDFKSAVDDFNKVLELDADNILAHYNRGNSWMKLKQYDMAIKDFEKVIIIDSDNASAFYNRGLAFFYKEKYNLAIADFEEALILDPQLKSKALKLIQSCHMKLKK